jgi:Family of unknown function (DUF5681)
MPADQTVSKQRGRPFEKGRSGNPAGRPPGARGKAALLAEALVEADCAMIVTRLIEAAKAGDVGAAKVLMDRLLPAKKDRHLQFELPRIETAVDASVALNCILEGVSAGEITPAEGDSLCKLVESSARIVELALLEQRVAALETARG